MLVALLQQPTFWNLLSQLATSQFSLTLLTWLMLKPASAQADDDLLSFLPFEDDLQDYSSHGHAANPSGMIHFVNGSIGSAVSIDSGYLELQNSAELLPAYGDYSVSLWFKTKVLMMRRHLSVKAVSAARQDLL